MIEVQNLSFQYPGAEHDTLSDLSFEIAEGEIFGFLGPSGAGKSTCQKILYKILHDYSGAARIDGRELSEWGTDYLQRIGVGFELPNHYLKLSARENLKLFSTFYPRTVALPGLFERVGLLDDIDKEVAAYSKGMKMRLNFIRAIMHQPEILFLDEPTSGMDPTNAHLIKSWVKELKKEGKTIFITTHDMATADELCDRVAFIVDGRLVTTDSPETLKRAHGEHRVEVKYATKTESFPLTNLAENSDFLAAIRHDIESIHSQEATLEEVFIKVTGKGLQ